MAEETQRPDIENMSHEEKVAILKNMYDDGDFDESLFRDILGSLEKDIQTGEISDDAKNEFFDLYQVLQDSDHAQSKRSGVKGKELIREFADVAASLSDLSTAGQQIAEGEASAAASTPPTPPKAFDLDPAISTSISESLKGISPSGIAAQVAPVKQDIQDAFTGDLTAAKVAAGGQSGVFGSLAQSAVNRRLKSAGNLGLLRQQIRESNLRNLNYALQNRLSERRLQQQRNLNVYGNELNQFNREQLAAGELEKSGRINRRFALQNLTKSLLPFADRVIDSPSVQNAASNVANKLTKKSNSAGIQDPGAIEGLDTQMLDFDSFDETSLFDYNEALDRDLFMNQYRGLA